MNFQEYDSVKTMMYDEYCSYLQNKYGLSSCDYTFGSSGKDKRSNDGLELHHIQEDIVPALSNRTVAESNPIEYQQPQNLCYCDYLEHMLLHVLIFEEDMENNYNDNVVGIMGVINHMVKRLNDFYCKDLVGYKDYEVNAYHKIKDDVDVYLEIIKRIFDATPQNIHSTICNKLCMSKNNSEECQELRNNLYNDIAEMISIVQEHNKEYAKKIDETIANSNKCLFILGTSMGKTTTGLDYIIKHGIRGLVVHHQNNIKDVWDKNNDLVDTISIQTLCQKFSSFDFSKYGIVIFDEAHHLSAPEWGKPIRFCIDNNIPVLGLTATPKKEVEELFGKDNVVYGYDVFEGIEKGILHPVSYIGALYTLPDKIKHAKEHPEELTPILRGKLDIALNNTPAVAEILYKNMPSGNRKGIIFAQDISDMNDAIDIVKNVFPYYDYKVISSHETEEHNKNVKEWFEKTDRGFLCSVDMVSEGSHFNGVNTLIMLRKTKSRIKFEQQLGRVMIQTKYPDPNCIVFDLVNNALTTELFTEKLRRAVGGRGDVSVIHPGEDVVKDPDKKYIIVEDYTKPLVELNKGLNGFWTEEEDNIIREFYPTEGATGCRKKLKNRARETIKKRAKRIGVKSNFRYGVARCIVRISPSSQEIKQYIAIQEVEQDGFSRGGVLQCCQRKMQKSGGYYWAYAEDFNENWIPPKATFERNSNSWTEEEIEIIKKYYSSEGSRGCAERLKNRKIATIDRVARKLGIEYIGDSWQPNEDEIIKKYYPTEGTSGCVKRLSGRTPTAITARASRIGVNLNPPWSEEELQLLKCYYPVEGAEGVKKYLPHKTVNQIASKAQSLKIKSLKHQKRVKCIETGREFSSATEAVKLTGFTSIPACAQGKIKTAGGYHWEYVEEENEEIKPEKKY